MDRLAFWGAPQDLIDAGIAPATHVLRRKHWTKGNTRWRYNWRAYFAPSGCVLYATHRKADEDERRHDESDPWRKLEG